MTTSFEVTAKFWPYKDRTRGPQGSCNVTIHFDDDLSLTIKKGTIMSGSNGMFYKFPEEKRPKRDDNGQVVTYTDNDGNEQTSYEWKSLIWLEDKSAPDGKSYLSPFKKKIEAAALAAVAEHDAGQSTDGANAPNVGSAPQRGGGGRRGGARAGRGNRGGGGGNSEWR